MAVADCHSVGFSLVPFRADVQIEHSSPKQYWRMSSQINRQEVNTWTCPTALFYLAVYKYLENISASLISNDLEYCLASLADKSTDDTWMAKLTGGERGWRDHFLAVFFPGETKLFCGNFLKWRKYFVRMFSANLFADTDFVIVQWHMKLNDFC